MHLIVNAEQITPSALHSISSKAAMCCAVQQMAMFRRYSSINSLKQYRKNGQSIKRIKRRKMQNKMSREKNRKQIYNQIYR